MSVIEFFFCEEEKKRKISTDVLGCGGCWFGWGEEMKTNSRYLKLGRAREWDGIELRSSRIKWKLCRSANFTKKNLITYFLLLFFCSSLWFVLFCVLLLFFLTFFSGRSSALSWVWREFSWAGKTTRSHASVNREFPNCLCRFIMCSCSISFLLVDNLHDEASSARFFHDNVKLFTSSEKSICVAVWPFPTFRVGMNSLQAPPILVRHDGNFVSGEKQKKTHSSKPKANFRRFQLFFDQVLKIF